MNEDKTQPVINNELSERLNKAYIAKEFTLLNGGTDNILMVRGEKNGQTIDILFVYGDVVQILKDIEPDTIKNETVSKNTPESND